MATSGESSGRIDDLLVQYDSSAATGQAGLSGHSHDHLTGPNGQSYPNPSHCHAQPYSSPTHDHTRGGKVVSPRDGSKFPWSMNGVEKEEANYPTSAAEILSLLREGVAILSGGRDKQGQSIITFPSQPKGYTYQRDSVRRVVQYLACIPAMDVREYGFSVIVDARNSSWSSTKLILRAIQEVLPGQIHVAYIVQPGQFWQKQQSSRGHNKEKSKLEFTTVKLSAVEKLTRHVDGSQLTSDLGGFLPYNHEQWLSLRQDLEHFISLFNALMEHNMHIEQQIRMEQESSEADSVDEQLKHHLPLQDMVKRAPQDAIRKGNDLLRTLERGRDESATGMTPDKINAVAIIKRLLDKIGQRQVQLEELWKERKNSLEQSIQLQGFEKSVQKVRGWLRTRGDDMLAVQTDIGMSIESVQSLLDQHEKVEAKARFQYNMLTQLRRNADRYSGERHFAAESMQKVVSKLSSKFTKFESKMSARRDIIETSMRLHTSLSQWREQCKVVIKVLQQEGVEFGVKEMESQEQLIQQLRQIGDVVLEEAGTLTELMATAANQSAGRGGEEAGNHHGTHPDYSMGISHVKRITDEVDNHRRRLGQLAEARKVQAEQLKQIDACEKDAKQETNWLEYMCNQLSTTYGDIGNSVAAVDQLILDHNKFMETAKKSYKYGCGLISAAEKSRRSFQLKLESNSILLANHTSCWDKLSTGASEVEDRLKVAHRFHSLSEEVLSSFNEWMKPLHELPKTPELIEKTLSDIAERKDNLFQITQECLAAGHSLFDRLGRPILPGEEFQSPNEQVQKSRSYLEDKLQSLEKRFTEVEGILPQQEQLLREFITYCQFEKRIEMVLLWLQRSGLKKLPIFSSMGDSKETIKKQLLSFREFHEEAKEFSEQVDELVSSASETEAVITGFRSDLVKKTDSLKAVWDKFLQRVQNRGTVLTMAHTFHTSTEQIRDRTLYLTSAMSAQAIFDEGGSPYLNSLIQFKRELDELFESALHHGKGLVEIFNKSPLDPDNPVIKISDQISHLEEERKKINEAWEEAWQLSWRDNDTSLSYSGRDETTPSSRELESSGSKSDTPLDTSTDRGVAKTHVHLVSSSNEVKKVTKMGGVSRRDSDKYSELEEEAYEYLEWLESEYESFVLSHSQFHDNSDDALAVKNQYDEFLVKLEPTCRKVERVIELLIELRPHAPLLVQSIDQLCQVVSDRVKSRKDSLIQSSKVLHIFAQFCKLYKEVDSSLLSLEGKLSEDISGDMALDVAQELLEDGRPLAEQLRKDYDLVKELGESFLTITSAILCSRGGPKLGVGGACTSVAVDLGDLEGRGLDLLNQWKEKEKQLVEIVDWQVVKLNGDQICLWLRESAELFLQNHTDIGTSLETAEDLLTEHHEFQIRAERTASEVTSLLAKSKEMQSHSHPNTPELGELTNTVTNLHTNFESRFEERKKLLEATVEFYCIAKELTCDMEKAIGHCGSHTGKDLPSHLKITSISSRFTNLRHKGRTLCTSLATKPQTSKDKRQKKVSITRSNSTSASEVAINETISSLEAQFTSYKDAFEKRRLSSEQMPSLRTQRSISPISPTLAMTKGNLKSPLGEHGHVSHMDTIKQGGTEVVTDKARPSDQMLSSVGRSTTVNVLWPVGKVGGAKGQKGSAVKEKVAALNERSKEDTVPIQELGTSFGPRQRTKPTNIVLKKGESRDFPNNNTTEMEKQPPSSAPGVPLRKKNRALSKAERSRKIEDIKKLFESSEIEYLTAQTADVYVWTPKSSSLRLKRESSAEEVSPQRKISAPESQLSTTTPAPVNVSAASTLPPPVAPPSETRSRLNTAPTIIRTVIKDHAPPKKQVITINVDLPADSADQNADSASISAEVANQNGDLTEEVVVDKKEVMTTPPSQTKDISPSRDVPLSHGKEKGRSFLKGKVSTLRNMFDSQSKSQDCTDSNLKSPEWKVTSKVASTTLNSSITFKDHPSKNHTPKDHTPKGRTCEDHTTSNHTSKPLNDSGTQESQTLRVISPPRPSLPNLLDLSPSHSPPPRPPPPSGYYSESSHTSDVFNDGDAESVASTLSDSGSSLLGELELDRFEHENWNENEVDGEWAIKPRPLRSLTRVLSEVVLLEHRHLHSLEILKGTYKIHLINSPHTPSFLQGSEEKIFANIDQLCVFQRRLCEELSAHEDSLEGVCNSFIENWNEFKYYVPFLANMEQGLKILTDYGGSFFTDKQREIEDELGIVGHFCQPVETLLQRVEQFKDMCYCAQKQYLHGVRLVKDVLKLMTQLLREVDNAIGLSKLCGAPDMLSDGQMVCRDQFLVYTTRGKKRKVHTMSVFLHPSKVVFARTRKEERRKESTYLEFYEALETADMHLLETYKTHEERFALCEGRLDPENLFVLEPLYQPLLVKKVWLQEIWPILQKRNISRGVLVDEEEMPLPPFFRPFIKSSALSKPEEGELKRTSSFRNRLSMRRKRRAESGEASSVHSGGVALDLSKSERRDARVRSSLISSTSSTTSSIPAPPLTDVHLASFSSKGKFQPEEDVEDVYVVVAEHLSGPDDDFLTVKEGQLVEVLDMSGKGAWLVLTLPQSPGEEQVEGFVPAHCLRVAKSNVSRQSSKSLGKHASKLSGCGLVALDEAGESQSTQHEQFEAETGQEVPQGTGGSKEEDQTDFTNVDLKPKGSEDREVCSEETTGQELSSPIHAVDSSHVDSSHQPLPPPLPLTPPPPAVGEEHSGKALTDSFSEHDGNSLTLGDRSSSRSPSLPPIGSGFGRGKIKFSFKGGPLSSSLQSLPTSFSPVVTPAATPSKFLGYNPMMIPMLTMSQPNIPQIKIDPAYPPHLQEVRQRGELSQLQWATVKATETSLEDFDPVEVFIAIADFVAIEESNISLRAGQCVQVLDDSRDDWWLVVSSESESQGWVPANYLEQHIIEGPLSPPPDPFQDVTGELASIMMRNKSPSEISAQRRKLYKAPFLTPSGQTPQEPSEAQLQGMFSIQMLYVAVMEVEAKCPEQVSVIKDQPLKVLDSRRSDWWLVKTIPDEDDSLPSVEGWILAALLQPHPDIREDILDSSIVSSSRGGGVVMRHHSMGPRIRVTPPTTSQWVVLANYVATEPGMLTVNEGEIVEVLDTSRNEWCLVKPLSRVSMEGWVPTAYLHPYDNQGYSRPNQSPSPRFRHLSSSEDSDTPTEASDRSSLFSPEVLEKYDDEERRLDAEERRRYVLSELSKTEQDYVDKLHFCLMNYDPEVDGDSAPKPLCALRNTLFGNLDDIYLFHKNTLLPKLLESESDPTKLGDVFIDCKEELKLYVAYCKNKASSDDIYHEFFGYFEELRADLKDRQKLPDYLILPVQRITKYGLLLSDFHKYSIKAGLSTGNIDKGLEVTRSISTQANNAIHLSLIEGLDRNEKFGGLVLQDLFLSQESNRQISKERRVFLFQRALLITKRRRKEESEVYAIKEQILLHDASMIQDMDIDKRNLIVYDMITGTKFVLRAAKTVTRDMWLTKSCLLIQQAKKDISNQLAARSRSTSEPTELARAASFSRKAMFRKEREGSKRKVKRPSSSTGVRENAEDMVPPGTEYVVMECIVLEGEDDLTLEPGDVVQLVRATVPDAPLVRVRTMDENKLEGCIPSSYLRRRDSIKGTCMESTPKFTMHPADLDLRVGSMAAISCSFNGYPAPSVIWRRDHEILLSEERRKIMSCGTSSVLELNKLEYDDEGRYSCYITNCMGSDSTTMTLTLHGPPSEPSKPLVSKVTSTSVKLKWAVPDMDGGVPVLSYQIEMLQDGFDQWQPIVQQPRNYFVVKTLEPSTSYRFRVSAVNEYGFSPPSEQTDLVVTKGKGLLNSSPSFKKSNLSAEVKENQEDELGVEDVRHPFIRRGSVSSAYDIMPEELGRGRFGIVHGCHHRQTGLQYAAKFVRLRSRKKAWIRKEVEILQRIRGKSPYLLEFEGAFERGRNLIIITELVTSGELLETIVTENNLTEAIAVGYLSQLLSAVDTLHKLKIAHLDIRPENILLSLGRIKVIDFGTSRDLSLNESTPLFASSVEFSAPEIVNQDTPTLTADMWSIGVLTYVMLSGLSPFFTENIQAVVERIKDARYSFFNQQFDNISQEAKDFISALLQKSPDFRMSASNAFGHSWIKMLGNVTERTGSPWPMAKLDISQLKSFIARRKWHTSSVAVDDTTVYGPHSMNCFSPTPPDFEEQARNEDPPRLFDGPSHVTGHKGSSVTLQFHVSGSPIPSVMWEHEGHGEVKMSLRRRVVELSGGVTSLTISEVKCEDEGVYVCSAVNSLGSVQSTCQLTVLMVPCAPSDVNTIILGSYNSALISWLPPAVDGHAPISKYLLERRRVEFEGWEEVSSDIDGAAHVVDDLLPGVAYMFRVSAINEVGRGPASEPSEPVTIETGLGYDSDSPTFDQVRVKTTSFDLEYLVEEEISRGKFSTVMKCKERSTDYVYAAKIFSVENNLDLRGEALQELEIMRELTHPRIVTLEDAFDNEDKIVLIQEYLGGGNLSDYVESHTVLTEYISTRLTRKLMEGLHYLHESRVIHVNLTPDNIFLTVGFGDLKIGGLGTARYIETGNQLTNLDNCGVEFLAPEAVNLQPLTTGADIWSAGVIACHMVSGRSPFLRDTEEATISAIMSASVDLNKKELLNLSVECRDFVSSCLVRNPRRRPTAQQCLRHRWLLGNNSGRRSSTESNSSPLHRRRESTGSSPITRRRGSDSMESTGSNSPSHRKSFSSDYSH